MICALLGLSINVNGMGATEQDLSLEYELAQAEVEDAAENLKIAAKKASIVHHKLIRSI